MTTEQAKNVLKVCDALESDCYLQGYGQLRSPDGEFCCLGVACDVYGKEKGVSWLCSEDDWMFLSDEAALPHVVGQWLGFNSSGPEILGFDDSADANDAGVDFPTIAAEWRKLAMAAIQAESLPARPSPVAE